MATGFFLNDLSENAVRNGVNSVALVQRQTMSCCKLLKMIGAEGGSRTRTTLRSTDFKSVASAIPPPRHVRQNTMRRLE
jgi:hypothetical protein